MARLFSIFFFLFCFSSQADHASASSPDTAISFVCSSLMLLEASDVEVSNQISGFLPSHPPASPAMQAARDWLRELRAQQRNVLVVVKTGDRQEIAHFFYDLATLTDERIVQVEDLRANASLFSRPSRTYHTSSAIVFPVDNPGRFLQIETQSLGHAPFTGMKPQFVTVELPATPALWEPMLFPDSRRLPREIGVLLTPAADPRHLRAAFLLVQPKR